MDYNYKISFLSGRKSIFNGIRKYEKTRYVFYFNIKLCI